ncbi:NnrU [Candidatus Magnetoovum chiemensis]|nr:NnrU [Candidatus Magnetoovum chiemensis]
MVNYLNIVYITIIFGLFALLHSILVTDKVKKLSVRFLGELFVKSAYRFIYTVISVLTIVIALHLIRTLPDAIVFNPPVYIKVGMYLFQIIGAVITLLAFRKISGLEFVGVKQLYGYFKSGSVEGNIEGVKDDQLITSGVYGLVRHPLYLGGILFVTFNTHLSVNYIALSILADIYFIFGGIIEERRFVNKYGQAYIQYQRDVPQFIPFLYKLTRLTK